LLSAIDAGVIAIVSDGDFGMFDLSGRHFPVTTFQYERGTGNGGIEVFRVVNGARRRWSIWPAFPYPMARTT
jgi:hypothetical protein